jgi:hypothetical protein
LRQGLTSTAATPVVLRLSLRRDGFVTAVTALVQAGACPDASDAVWWVELIVNAVEGDEAVTALRELTQSSVGFSMNFSCTCWAGNVLTALIVASELQPQARSRVSKRVVESAYSHVPSIVKGRDTPNQPC